MWRREIGGLVLRLSKFLSQEGEPLSATGRACARRRSGRGAPPAKARRRARRLRSSPEAAPARCSGLLDRAGGWRRRGRIEGSGRCGRAHCGGDASVGTRGAEELGREPGRYDAAGHSSPPYRQGEKTTLAYEIRRNRGRGASRSGARGRCSAQSSTSRPINPSRKRAPG